MATRSKQSKQAWGKTTVGASIAGAAGLAGIGWLLSRVLRSRHEPDGPAAALAHGKAPGHVGHSGGAKAAAGPETMRDPPGHWSKVDEAVDESFPASDPPALNSRVD